MWTHNGSLSVRAMSLSLSVLTALSFQLFPISIPGTAIPLKFLLSHFTPGSGLFVEQDMYLFVALVNDGHLLAELQQVQYSFEGASVSVLDGEHFSPIEGPGRM